MKFFRKNNKTIFLIFTPLLAVGLVLSFTIWSSPQPANNQGGTSGNTASRTASAQQNIIQKMLTDIRQYEQALKANPDNTTILVDLGNKAYDLGAEYLFELQNVEKGTKYFKKATEAYQKVVELGAADANVMTDLATAAMYSGQNELAEEFFKKAIETDAEHINSKVNYGYFLAFVKQEYDKALEQWEAALALNPDPDTKNRINSWKQEIKNRQQSNE